MSSVTIAIVSSIFAAIVGIVNLCVTMINSNKATYVNAVTSKRVEWMGQLRELVSDFIKLVTLHDDRLIDREYKDQEEYFDGIVKKSTQIKLQLNYQGDKDKQIINKIEMIISNHHKLHRLLIESVKEKNDPLEYYKKYLRTDMEFMEILPKNGANTIDEINGAIVIYIYNLKKCINGAISELVFETQIYLKEEWNRVKKEAEYGKTQGAWEEANKEENIKSFLKEIFINNYELKLAVISFLLIMLAYLAKQ